MSLSEENQSDVIEAFSSKSRYMDDILNTDNNNFDGLISQTCYSMLQLNETNSSETEAPFLNSHLSILDGLYFMKIYDKRDDFDFEM